MMTPTGMRKAAAYRFMPVSASITEAPPNKSMAVTMTASRRARRQAGRAPRVSARVSACIISYMCSMAASARLHTPRAACSSASEQLSAQFNLLGAQSAEHTVATRCGNAQLLHSLLVVMAKQKKTLWAVFPQRARMISSMVWAVGARRLICTHWKLPMLALRTMGGWPWRRLLVCRQPGAVIRLASGLLSVLGWAGIPPNRMLRICTPDGFEPGTQTSQQHVQGLSALYGPGCDAFKC